MKKIKSIVNQVDNVFISVSSLNKTNLVYNDSNMILLFDIDDAIVCKDNMISII